MNKFKIGDRVKITGYTSGYNKKGDVGIIDRFWTSNGGDIYARIDTGQGRSLEACHTGINSLEHELLINDEFQLPLNWVVRVTPENMDVLSLFKKSIHRSRESAYGYPFINGQGFGVGVGSNNQIITFNQFKKHILKIKPETIKTFEPLPFFKVLEVHNKNNDMLYVQNNEGNVFRLGDMIIGLTEHSKKLGSMKIISFRKTVNGNNICAVTKETTQYGIGIDKIQHVIIIKKEIEIINELLLDKAKRLYPNGTKYKRFVGKFAGETRESNGNFSISMYDKEEAIYCDFAVIYRDGQWAEIIKD